MTTITDLATELLSAYREEFPGEPISLDYDDWWTADLEGYEWDEVRDEIERLIKAGK